MNNPSLHKLVKQNGSVIEVNDKSLEYAISMGWKLAEESEKPKRGRRSGNGSNSG